MDGRDRLIDNPEEFSRVLKSEYEAGDKSALIRLIVGSALTKRPIPEWAADIMDRAYGYAVWGELASWDLVFGKPSRHRKSVIRKWKSRDRVFFRIFELSEHKGRPINDDLFEEVGRELGIGGKTEVKRLYAAARDALGWPQRRK